MLRNASRASCFAAGKQFCGTPGAELGPSFARPSSETFGNTILPQTVGSKVE